jgi:hypothetical protein
MKLGDLTVYLDPTMIEIPCFNCISKTYSKQFGIQIKRQCVRISFIQFLSREVSQQIGNRRKRDLRRNSGRGGENQDRKGC